MAHTDELIQQQRERAEWIKKISEKFTREPKVRRTKDFVRERLIELNLQWEEFKKGDEEIRGHRDFDENHLYIKSKYYEQVETTVLAVRRKLEARLDEILVEEIKKAEEAPKPIPKMPSGTPKEEQTQDKQPNNETQTAYIEDTHDDVDEEQRRRLKRQEAQIQAFVRSVGRV